MLLRKLFSRGSEIWLTRETGLQSDMPFSSLGIYSRILFESQGRYLNEQALSYNYVSCYLAGDVGSCYCAGCQFGRTFEFSRRRIAIMAAILAR